MLDLRLLRLSDQSHTHAHGHHQMVLSLAGRAEFEVAGKGGEVCRMRACLLPGDTAHAFAGVGDNRMLILDLADEAACDHAPAAERALLGELFDVPRYPLLDAEFQHLLAYAGAELARYGDQPELARALGGLLLQALHLRLRGETRSVQRTPLDRERIEAHIERHLGRRIGVAELAQVACLSPSHFHQQFKDCFGLTPHQYLLKARLDRASRLLRDSPLPLVRIAEECGFSSQSALTTAMRRYLGLTPRGLRRSD